MQRAINRGTKSLGCCRRCSLIWDSRTLPRPAPLLKPGTAWDFVDLIGQQRWPSVSPGGYSRLLEGPTHTYLHYYRVVNARLDDLGLRISSYLQVRGFRTFPIPSSQRVSRDRLAGIFPHRLAAQLAGLGWIGKSGSLITREFGPRIRLVTVLTDAPLCPNQPVDSAAKNCGECQLCIKSCPAQASKGGGPGVPGRQRWPF